MKQPLSGVARWTDMWLCNGTACCADSQPYCTARCCHRQYTYMQGPASSEWVDACRQRLPGPVLQGVCGGVNLRVCTMRGKSGGPVLQGWRVGTVGLAGLAMSVPSVSLFSWTGVLG
jgi:hypothetical protein